MKEVKKVNLRRGYRAEDIAHLIHGLIDLNEFDKSGNKIYAVEGSTR